MKKKKEIELIIGSIVIGTLIGMLFAPKSGEALRKDLKSKLDEFITEAKKIDLEEVKKDFLDKLDDLKNDLEDLDKEKVLEIAKEKSEAVKEKSLELLDYAKEKGTPVLEKMADDIRLKAINVTKDVLKKLENTIKKKSHLQKTA